MSSRLVLVLLLLVGLVSSTDRPRRPHIITVLVDDLGWNDVGFHGSDQVSTPNVDALAYSGVILNRHYVLPTCTPSRAALLTGSHPIRTGMQGYPMRCGTRRRLPLSAKLQPEYLRHLGYRTHLVGKWHLGYSSAEHVPNRRGFDTFFGYYNGYIDYFNYGLSQSFVSNGTEHSFYGYDLHFNDRADRRWKGRYATRVFGDRARKIIRRHDASRPLFLFVSHLGVHTGREDGTGLEVPSDANVTETFSHIADAPRRELAGVLQEIDASVGAIVKALQRRNMLNDSIILFLSDNGGHTVSTDMQPNWSSNWPLRGMKFTLFEGGVRGAAVIWSPLLPKGFVSDQFLHITDWLPTLFHAAGGHAEDVDNVDGVDQWTSLRDKTPVDRDHILLNIDDVEGDEGIILDNRWKVKRGGLKRYGNYDYHWGEERNVRQPDIDGYYSRVRRSVAARAILKLDAYRGILSTKRMRATRRRARLECDVDRRGEPSATADGYVDASASFLCDDYCVYDLLADPCETRNIRDRKLVERAAKLLDDYRRQSRTQGSNDVDPDSDPRRRDGVWMPWLVPRFSISSA